MEDLLEKTGEFVGDLLLHGVGEAAPDVPG
jgi:hypothetical protein